MDGRAGHRTDIAVLDNSALVEGAKAQSLEPMLDVAYRRKSRSRGSVGGFLTYGQAVRLKRQIELSIALANVGGIPLIGITDAEPRGFQKGLVDLIDGPRRSDHTRPLRAARMPV